MWTIIICKMLEVRCQIGTADSLESAKSLFQEWYKQGQKTADGDYEISAYKGNLRNPEELEILAHNPVLGVPGQTWVLGNRT